MKPKWQSRKGVAGGELTARLPEAVRPTAEFFSVESQMGIILHCKDITVLVFTIRVTNSLNISLNSKMNCASPRV